MELINYLVHQKYYLLLKLDILSYYGIFFFTLIIHVVVPILYLALPFITTVIWMCVPLLKKILNCFVN